MACHTWPQRAHFILRPAEPRAPSGTLKFVLHEGQEIIISPDEMIFNSIFFIGGPLTQHKRRLDGGKGAMQFCGRLI